MRLATAETATATTTTPTSGRAVALAASPATTTLTSSVLPVAMVVILPGPSVPGLAPGGNRSEPVASGEIAAEPRPAVAVGPGARVVAGPAQPPPSPSVVPAPRWTEADPASPKPVEPGADQPPSPGAGLLTGVVPPDLEPLATALLSQIARLSRLDTATPSLVPVHPGWISLAVVVVALEATRRWRKHKTRGVAPSGRCPKGLLPNGLA